MIKTCQQSDRVFTVTVTLARTCPLQLITLYKYKKNLSLTSCNINQIMKNGGVVNIFWTSNPKSIIADFNI